MSLILSRVVLVSIKYLHIFPVPYVRLFVNFVHPVLTKLRFNRFRRHALSGVYIRYEIAKILPRFVFRIKDNMN